MSPSVQVSQLEGVIEHTCLAPAAPPDTVLRYCREARHYSLFGVCVNPVFVAPAARALSGSEVRLVAVVGFPLGASLGATKAFECERAVADGAHELDMVGAIGALKAGDHAAYRRDVGQVVGAAQGRPVKVILETALLSDEEKRVAAQLCEEAGAAFVKTSTGFAAGGATVHDVALLRASVGPELGVKASGGIRTARTARAMLDAGANRIGTSAGVDLVSAP